jgi:hypothetical protein
MNKAINSPAARSQRNQPDCPSSFTYKGVDKTDKTPDGTSEWKDPSLVDGLLY